MIISQSAQPQTRGGKSQQLKSWRGINKGIKKSKYYICTGAQKNMKDRVSLQLQ